MGILSDTFKSPQARRKAFTAFSAGQPVGTALGTVVGGAMTQLTKYIPIFFSLYQHLTYVTGNPGDLRFILFL